MQAARRIIGAVADNRDHLPKSACLAFRDQPPHECCSQTTPEMFGMNIYGVLDGKPVRGAKLEWRGIGVSGNHPVTEFGDNPRKSAAQKFCHAGLDFAWCGSGLFKGAARRQHVMRINLRNCLRIIESAIA